MPIKLEPIQESPSCDSCEGKENLMVLTIGNIAQSLIICSTCRNILGAKLNKSFYSERDRKVRAFEDRYHRWLAGRVEDVQYE